jgi:DNA-binding NarL/FixJ family response regulator
MTTDPGPARDGPRQAGDDEIISRLNEIVDLLRSFAEHDPCRPAPPAGSGRGTNAEISRKRPGEPPQAPIARLTRRERQVLDILITGASNRMIARQLGIAERTVKNNLYAIYRKLGVSGRAEAIARTLGDASQPSHPPRGHESEARPSAQTSS